MDQFSRHEILYVSAKANTTQVVGLGAAFDNKNGSALRAAVPSRYLLNGCDQTV